jgi:hypothetical protein
MFVDGVLSGRLTISASLDHPQLRGFVYLINGRLLGGAPFSTGINFGGQSATIDFARIAQKEVRRPRARASSAPASTARGEIDFHDLTDIRVRVLPNEPVTALTLLEPDDCVNGIEFLPNGTAGLPQRQLVDEIGLRGSFSAPEWTISLNEKHSADPLETFLRGGSSRTFRICHDLESPAKTLTLGVAQFAFP